MTLDPVTQLGVQRVAHHHAPGQRGALGVAEHHAQTQTGRAAAIAHALLHVLDQHFADRVGAGQNRILQCVPYRLVLLTLARHHQRHAAIVAGEQLRVEQIGGDGILEADGFQRHADRDQRRGQLGANLVKHRLFIAEGQLVIEQHRAIAHRDHIVVEDTGIDGVRVLLGEYHLTFAQAMLTRDGLTGFQRLARRIATRFDTITAEGLTAIDVEMHARPAVAIAQPRMVGGALIGEGRRRGQRGVMREVAIVGEDGAQDAPGGRGLQVTMEAGLQVGRREMHAAITAVARRRDGSGVGRPHAGGGTHRAQKLRCLLAGRLQHLGVAAGEAEIAQRAKVRALLR